MIREHVPHAVHVLRERAARFPKDEARAAIACFLLWGDPRVCLVCGDPALQARNLCIECVDLKVHMMLTWDALSDLLCARTRAALHVDRPFLAVLCHLHGMDKADP